MNPEALVQKAISKLPENVQGTAMLKLFGILKVPMLFWINASVYELDDTKITVKVPLNRRTKNHLNSMYFGVLACGADAAGGLMAMRLIQKSGRKVSLAFKDFQADFLKRAEGDTYFKCEDGELIEKLVNKTIETGERINETVNVTAYCPDKLGDEPVATFKLTLSLKDKTRR